MAEQKTLNSILNRLNKDFGDNTHKVISTGVEDLRSYGTLSLGSPSLDFCLYNSFPERRMVEFFGAEGSGKTTLAYIAAASYQKKEVERNPENPRAILYIDLEGGVDPDWASKMGYNMNSEKVKTIHFLPMDMTAEQIFDAIIEMIKTEEVGFIVIDSLNMLDPQQTHEDSFEKKDMGGVAKSLGSFVKRIKLLLVKYNCTLIGINQLRENINGYGNPETTSGGRGWKHGCDLRLKIKRGNFIDENNEEVKSTAESPAGYVMEMAVAKTKVCKWDRKLGRANINYDKGIDILQDTIDVAIYFGLIDNSVQGSFAIIDPKTGEIMLDEDGKEVKIRGKKNVKPYLEVHLDIWKYLYKRIYELLSRKDDPNIKSFEEMLGINIADSFNIDFSKEDE